jgi:hypothetical protein
MCGGERLLMLMRQRVNRVVNRVAKGEGMEGRARVRAQGLQNHVVHVRRHADLLCAVLGEVKSNNTP